MVHYRKATIYIILTVLLFLKFIPFLGGKHNCLHAKSRYKWGEVLQSYYLSKEKMPTLAGNKHHSVHFFLHRPRLFRLSADKVRVRSVGNGHQSGYSRADTIKRT